MSRTTMLRDFLRSRRARATPEEAGLPLGLGARRVPGPRRLLLENLSTPAFVLGRLLDLLAMNEPAHPLFRGLGARGNYLRWLILDAPGKAPYADWNVAAHEAIAMLRFDAARHPHDRSSSLSLRVMADPLVVTLSLFNSPRPLGELRSCRGLR